MEQENLEEKTPELKRIGNVQPTSDPKMSIFILGLSALLILVALLAGGYFFIYAKNHSHVSPTVTADPNQIIPTESSLNIAPSQNQSPVDAFIQTKSSLPIAAPINFITRINISSIDGPTFAGSLSPNIPPELIRALDTPFMTGYYFGTVWQPFIIFKLTSYQNAYPGMLSWEKTIGSDLQNITESTATSSTFQDIKIKNKDGRELVDQSGKVILVYSLPDPETLVITTTEEALVEILSRLSTSQFSPTK